MLLADSSIHGNYAIKETDLIWEWIWEILQLDAGKTLSEKDFFFLFKVRACIPMSVIFGI